MASNRFLSYVENLPSVAFLILWRFDVGLRVSGWVAAGLAVCVLLALWGKGRQADGLLLGINLNFALAAPIIHMSYLAGFTELVACMLAYVGVSVLLTVALTGVALERFSQRGFSGCGDRRKGLILIGLAFAGAIWSLCFAGQQFLSVGLPLLVLFVVRRLLWVRPASIMGLLSMLLLMAPRRAQDILA